MAEASRTVRDHMLTHDSQGVESQRLVVASVARAVWRQDDRLASRLLKSSPLAPSLLGLFGNYVFLLDPPSFDRFYNDTRLSQKQEAFLYCRKKSKLRLASILRDKSKLECKGLGE